VPGGGAWPGGIGGLIPGGGAIPGGGGPLTPGGGGPLGIIPMLGAPTPRPGPASPAGACPIGVICIALPAACAFPGPPAPPSPISLAGWEGGASALIVTMFSPLRRTRPRARFISLSFSFGFLGFIFLNSSVSESTRFMCLSKAMKVPTSIRESLMVTRTL